MEILGIFVAYFVFIAFFTFSVPIHEYNQQSRAVQVLRIEQ